jgi:hypothetical protein
MGQVLDDRQRISRSLGVRLTNSPKHYEQDQLIPFSGLSRWLLASTYRLVSRKS